MSSCLQRALNIIEDFFHMNIVFLLYRESSSAYLIENLPTSIIMLEQ